ncbi:MAG: hypothetical protein ACYTGG_01690 [Planctomycetota bacterium]
MQIILDQRACDLDASSVGEAIAGAAALAEQDGRMIVDIYVDGTRWTEEDLAAASRAEDRADEVRLVSADRCELAHDVFADAAVALGEASDLQRAAAELFQADDTVTGMQKLETAIGIWMSVSRAVELGASVTGADLETIRAGDQPATSVVNGLANRLKDLFAAMESQDHVRLADILLYEMTPVVDGWQELLVTLQQHAKS